MTTGREGQSGRPDRKSSDLLQGLPVVLICHYQTSGGQLALSSLVPGLPIPHCGFSPAPATDALIQPSPPNSMAGERGWQGAYLAGQAPCQVSPHRSGACGSQLCSQESCHVSPPWYPPSGGWELILLPAMPHRRTPLGEMPSGEGHSASPERDLWIKWRSRQNGREFSAPPLLPLQGLIAGRLAAI